MGSTSPFAFWCGKLAPTSLGKILRTMAVFLCLSFEPRARCLWLLILFCSDLSKQRINVHPWMLQAFVYCFLHGFRWPSALRVLKCEVLHWKRYASIFTDSRFTSLKEGTRYATRWWCWITVIPQIYTYTEHVQDDQLWKLVPFLTCFGPIQRTIDCWRLACGSN